MRCTPLFGWIMAVEIRLLQSLVVSLPSMALSRDCTMKIRLR